MPRSTPDPEAVLRDLFERRPTIDEILKRGLPCFPVKATWKDGKFVKKPMVMAFTTKPPTTEAQIRKAFDKNPDYNAVGVPTGKISGLDALDIDPRNGGNDWLRDVELPTTRTQETLSGGKHFLFKHAEGVGSKAEGFAKGVDWRGDGGFIVDWSLSGFPVQHAPVLADWPPWLLRQVLDTSRMQREDPTLFTASCNQPPPSDAEVLAMLGVISSDVPYDEWWMIAAPIRRALGDDGYDVWHDWCRKSAKYSERAADKKWDEALKVHSFGFGTLFYLADKADPTWRKTVDPKERTLAGGKDGRPAGGSENIKIAIAKLGVELRFNEFSSDIEVSGLAGYGPLLNDATLIRLRFAVETRFKLLANKALFYDAVVDLAHANKFHPVRDYLDGLKWDRTKRIDSWLVTYAGADDTPYVQAIGALLLTAAVKRVRQPGCKFDEMPVLEGAQGIGKSEALAILAVRDEWFFDGLCLASAGDGKRAIEDVRGRWLIESAEMSGMRKADVQRLKGFLSRRIDRARLSYDRMPTSLPRQCVFVGTTNDSKFLRDHTGNRRYWPVLTKKFDLGALKRDLPQLWAEAAEREAADASIRMDQSLWEAAAEEQEARMVDDPWFDALDAALGHCKHGRITTSGALLLEVPVERQTEAASMRVGQALEKLGWRRPNASKTISVDGKLLKGFVIGERPWPYVDPVKFGAGTGPEQPAAEKPKPAKKWKPSVVKG